MESEASLTYKTSMKPVVREGLIMAGGVLVCAVIIQFVQEGQVYAEWMGYSLVMAAGTFAFFVGRYLLMGVGGLSVTPTGIVIHSRSGAEDAHPWTTFTDIWQEGKWIFQYAPGRIVIREYGFTSAQWEELSAVIHHLKAKRPLETLPGVKTVETDEPRSSLVTEGADESAVVFESHYLPIIAWMPWLLGLFFIVILLISYSYYVEGKWLEEPLLTVIGPIFTGGLLLLWPFTMTRMARRIHFGDAAMTVDFLRGTSKEVRYEDVMDHFGTAVRTRGGSS